MIYTAYILLRTGSYDFYYYSTIQGYLFVFAGGIVGLFLGRKMWEKQEKLETETNQLGDY